MPQRDFDTILSHTEPDIVNYVSQMLQPKAGDVARVFYTEMLDDPAARDFLDHDKVESRMYSMFESWATQALAPVLDLDPEALKSLHLTVGDTHARVGIPEEQVIHGIQVVKTFCLTHLIDECDITDRTQLRDSIFYINDLFDTCLSVMNLAYLQRSLEDERNAQALRFRLASLDLSVECERMKTELVTWTRDITFSSWSTATDGKSGIYQSLFGSWLNHKAPLHFSDYPELEQINGLTREMDGIAIQMANSEDGIAHRMEALNRIRAITDQVCFLINDLVQKSQREIDSLDPMTSLYSRRFLDSILQRENRIAQSDGDPYALMMLDLDDFKHVNDTYGHVVGDNALKHIANIMLQEVRQTDFCFRYGGDELLIILTNGTLATAQQKAETLLAAIRSEPLILEDGTQLSLTASIGVAVYNGHPDYATVLKRADSAAFQAKADGKNCWRLAG